MVPEQPNEGTQQKKPHEIYEKAEREEYVIRALETISTRTTDRIVAEHQAHRHQAERHETHKSQREYVTIGVLFAAAAAAIITVLVTHCDSDAVIREMEKASGQQHTDTDAVLREADASVAEMGSIASSAAAMLIDAQRAWLSADVSVAGLTYDVNGIRIHLRYTITNSGHSPAQNAYLNATAFPNVSYSPTALRDTCGDADRTGAVLGTTIFAGQIFNSETPVYVSAKNFNEYKKSIPRSFTFITPVVMTCVSYTISRDRIPHHTPIIYTLEMSDGRAIPIDRIAGGIAGSELEPRIARRTGRDRQLALQPGLPDRSLAASIYDPPVTGLAAIV